MNFLCFGFQKLYVSMRPILICWCKNKRLKYNKEMVVEILGEFHDGLLAQGPS